MRSSELDYTETREYSASDCALLAGALYNFYSLMASHDRDRSH